MENLEKPSENNNNTKHSPAQAPYKPAPMRLYRFAVAFLAGFVRFLFLADIKGSENMPKDGACFVCGNHISNWDPVFAAIAVKRPVHFMAKVQLFRIPLLGKLLRALGAFPVDRDAADIGAIKTALTYLKHDEPLGHFPARKTHARRSSTNQGYQKRRRDDGLSHRSAGHSDRHLYKGLQGSLIPSGSRARR